MSEDPKTYELSEQQLKAVWHAISIAQEGGLQAHKLIHHVAQTKYYEDDIPAELDAAEYIIDRIDEQLETVRLQLPVIVYDVPF